MNAPLKAEIFARDASRVLSVLEDVYDKPELSDADARMYTVKVHGIKSSLAAMGEKGLSAAAAALEQAGRDKNRAVIKSDTPAFLSALKELINKLDQANPNEVNKADKIIKNAELTGGEFSHALEKLLSIKKACEVYDQKAAKAALSELRQMPWPPHAAELLSAAADHLLAGGFDEAVRVIDRVTEHEKLYEGQAVIKMHNKKLPKIGIVGAGRIGADTATLYIGNGYDVTLVSRGRDGCERGRASVAANLKLLRGENLISDRGAENCMSYLTLSTELSDLGGADFVIESIVEKAGEKTALYARLEDICRPDTILMSATSAISPDILAEKLARKERFIVAHPWNPSHLVPLVEVVKSARTSDSTVDKTVELLESVGRAPVVLGKPIEGFIGNRLMHAMYREAMYLVETGAATPEQIDKTVMYSFGQRFSTLGLLEYYDSVGLDLQLHVESYLFKSLCSDDRPPELLERLNKDGKLGLKTGAGIFDWSKKDVDDFHYRRCKPFFRFLNWNIPEEKM